MQGPAAHCPGPAYVSPRDCQGPAQGPPAFSQGSPRARAETLVFSQGPPGTVPGTVYVFPGTARDRDE